MADYVVLQAQLDAEVAEVGWSTASVSSYSELVKVGGRLKALIRNLPNFQETVPNLDDFMFALIRSRIGAEAKSIAEIFEAINSGKIKTHAIEVPPDELSAANRPTGRPGSQVA